MKKTIAMTGGGTGGHLAIIKAVKESLNDEEIIYIGSTNGQDRAWFENDNDFIEKYFLDTTGVVNRGTFGKIKALLQILKATLETKKILKKHNVAVVFSVGGYSSAPSSFAAKLLGIPLVIHEQNAVVGKLNRLLKPYANEFISSYDDNSPIKDYPVAKNFFESARVRKSVSTIFFIGGSQGAIAINDIALKLAPTFAKMGIKIIHQAGERNIDSVKQSYKELGVDAEVFGFIDDIDKLMAKADFAIARAGASTLWELVANGLPTLFIPYPYAASDHQYYNAKYIEDMGGGYVMRESEIDIDEILKIISKDQSKLSQNLISYSKSDGANKIAKLLKDYQV